MSQVGRECCSGRSQDGAQAVAEANLEHTAAHNRAWAWFNLIAEHDGNPQTTHIRLALCRAVYRYNTALN